MPVVIAEEPSSVLQEYAGVSIAFERSGRAGARIVKDYDAVAGNSPRDWPARFDVSTWTFLTARDDGRCVAGAIAIYGSSEIDLLDGRDDLALIWDLRVAPAIRGQGIGSKLLAAAEQAMSRRGALMMKVETQDVNTSAVRFYQRHGYTVEREVPGAYLEFPDERQLFLYKRLTAAGIP
jgi:ribosomal protein S18 acetylase RimI-like enzyme